MGTTQSTVRYVSANELVYPYDTSDNERCLLSSLDDIISLDRHTAIRALYVQQPCAPCFL